jgi:hypothetical protein
MDANLTSTKSTGSLSFRSPAPFRASQYLRQLRHVGRDAPRLVAGEQLVLRPAWHLSVCGRILPTGTAALTDDRRVTRVTAFAVI